LYKPDKLSRTLQTLIQPSRYREIVLNAPAWRINNSYDIQLHRFRSPDFPDRVLIYQRLEPPSSNL